MPADLVLYPGAPISGLEAVVTAYREMLESGDLSKEALHKILVNAPRPDRPIYAWLLWHEGRPVGEVSLFNVEAVKAEVGVVMTEKCPKWLGASAFIKMCHKAFSDMRLQRLEAYIRASNAPAVAAAKRFGFKQEGALRRAASTINGKLETVLVFGLLKDEFYAKWGEKNGSGYSVHSSSSVYIRRHSTISNGKETRGVPEAARARSGN